METESKLQQYGVKAYKLSKDMHTGCTGMDILVASRMVTYNAPYDDVVDILAEALKQDCLNSLTWRQATAQSLPDVVANVR